MANDAVRRIMAEVKEFSALNGQPTTFFSAAPLESDLFEWHFTVRGPPDTPFEHGVYHGRILLPAEYPLKAPEIILLTPNGRFEVGTRICLSVTSHHQETWQPSWGIRTILTALVGFMPSKPEGVGALDYPESERRGLAKKSHTFYCARCHTTPAHVLPPRVSHEHGVLAPAPSSPASSPARDDPAAALPERSSESVVSATDGALPSVSADTLVSARGASRADGSQGLAGPEGAMAEIANGVVGEMAEVGTDEAVETVLSTNGWAGAEEKNATPLEDVVAAEQPGGTSMSEATVLSGATTTIDDTFEEDEITPVVDATARVARDMRSSTNRFNSALAEQEQVSKSMAQGGGSASRTTGSGGDTVQEPELLYIAYAIVGLMLAVIIRRIFKMVTE